jgi:hypothetical protein
MEKATGDFERTKAEHANKIQMEKAAHANKIQMEKAAHDNEMAMRREVAEVEAHTLLKQAEANKRLHTPEFLALKKSEAMFNNAKQIISGDAASAFLAKFLG